MSFMGVRDEQGSVDTTKSARDHVSSLGLSSPLVHRTMAVERGLMSFVSMVREWSVEQTSEVAEWVRLISIGRAIGRYGGAWLSGLSRRACHCCLPNKLSLVCFRVLLTNWQRFGKSRMNELCASAGNK